MKNEEFQKQQYLTLRREILESKSRGFWILIAGVILVVVAGALACIETSGFASAAIPIVFLVLVFAYAVEQNGIIRAGRFIRERVEPQIDDEARWEIYLQSHPSYRDVDRLYFVGFIASFMVFFALSCSVALVQLSHTQGSPHFATSAAVAYALGAVCLIIVLMRHWRSCTTTGEGSTKDEA